MKTINNLAIIPARGGSKGIKKKNLSKLNNKSLIEITALEIQKTKLFEKIILSSESQEILDHGLSIGIEIIKRPKQISKDNSRSEEAVIHALKRLSGKFNIKNVGLFQPTSPFRDHINIVKAFKKFKRGNFDSLISVTRIDSKYMKLIYQTDNSILSINDDLPFLPRQKLPNAYLPNGAIYIAKADHFQKQKSFFSKKMELYEMDKKSSLDIDTKKDLIKANNLIKKQNSF
tara:strand:+ start:12281 stop:12973 length:693 start_codon:yes stop_codon:yes gene_type:complete